MNYGFIKYNNGLVVLKFTSSKYELDKNSFHYICSNEKELQELLNTQGNLVCTCNKKWRKYNTVKGFLKAFEKFKNK